MIKTANKKIIALIVLALALVSFANAFSGTSADYDMNAIFGSNTGDAANSTGGFNSRTLGGSSLVGPYSGYSGFFGLLESSQSNTSETSISLINPINHKVVNTNQVNFNATISSTGDLLNCSLKLDGLIVSNVINPATGITSFVTSTNKGKHNWSVQCYDDSLQLYESQIYTFTVITSSAFDSDSTDFTTVNISNIPNLTLTKSNRGKVIFSGFTDLSNGIDFDEVVSFGTRNLYVDSSSASMLNKSAVVTFYNLSVLNPVILKDGVYCSECFVISSNGNLTFNVSHFSNYTVSENSQLTIFDDTDSVITYPGNNVLFYANYTSIITGLNITAPSVSCEINYQDGGPYIMTFNITSKMYQYNRTYNTTGVRTYDVLCNDTSDTYTGISLSDSYRLSSYDGPQILSNITIVSSERGNVSINVTAVPVGGGNISELTIDNNFISNSWQGLYGNINQTMILSDLNNNRFYDWSQISNQGEIYASRLINPNFPDIRCMNSTELANEEIFMGQISSQSDSVTNTFNNSIHPSFYVGNVAINSNTCNSTNLYVNSQSQTTEFYEILLSDGSAETVYVAIVNGSKQGFNSNLYDFQMLVGENGQDSMVTPYYLFLELG